MAGYVAVLEVDLHFPEAGSLKAKRKELKSLKALLHERYHVAVSETEYQDTWQRATLALALTSGSHAHLQEHADEVERFIDGRCPAGVGMRRTVVSLSELVDLTASVTRVSPATPWGG
jgi:uncharacterized protein